MTCRSTRAITQELLTQRDMLNTINRKITEGFKAMTSDQAHLDNDVQQLTDTFAAVIAELKAQNAAGTPLDFTKADALVGTEQAEQAADAPPAPTA